MILPQLIITRTGAVNMPTWLVELEVGATGEREVLGTVALTLSNDPTRRTTILTARDPDDHLVAAGDKSVTSLESLARQLLAFATTVVNR